MLRQSSAATGIVLCNKCVKVQQALISPSKQLEFEFIVDFSHCVYPIHCSYNYILLHKYKRVCIKQKDQKSQKRTKFFSSRQRLFHIKSG